VVRAKPDGYTLAIASVGLTANPSLYKSLAFEPQRDLDPITLIANSPTVLVVPPSLPVNTLPEFIAYAKANHNKMQYGSAGAGSATHMTCVLLNTAMGIDITHVPYRGTGPAMQDLMGGRIDYVCDVISTALPLIRSNSAKAIALLSPRRNPVLPELATADEQGLAGFDADAWNAFFLPRGTPEPVVRRLAKATSDALDLPWVRERLEGLGLNVPPPERRTPEYLAKLVPSELVKWAAPVKASGASTD
jgi:tripartite-type tricarboxylate transporter receptor subunit TctC